MTTKLFLGISNSAFGPKQTFIYESRPTGKRDKAAVQFIF